MGAPVQETEVFYPPTVNSWRRRPTREQIRFAMDLCRTELPYAQRIATVNTFAGLDSRGMSGLIEHLLGVRAARMRRLKGRRRPTGTPRAPGAG